MKLCVLATCRQAPFTKLPPGIFLCAGSGRSKQTLRVSELSCNATFFASCTEAPFQVAMNFTISLEDEHLVPSQYWMIMFVQEQNSYILCFCSLDNILVAYFSSSMQFISNNDA